MTDKPKRQQILETGIGLTVGDRNKTYGSPHSNLTTFAHLVNVYLKGLGWAGKKLDSVDGSIIMALAKVSRVAVNKHHDDNYVDAAVYMAIAGECAECVAETEKAETKTAEALILENLKTLPEEWVNWEVLRDRYGLKPPSEERDEMVNEMRMDEALMKANIEERMTIDDARVAEEMNMCIAEYRTEMRRIFGDSDLSCQLLKEYPHSFIDPPLPGGWTCTRVVCNDCGDRHYRYTGIDGNLINQNPGAMNAATDFEPVGPTPGSTETKR